MKSRITITLGEDNSPVIKLEYVDSNDVRDLLVKKFIEGFGNDSNLCHVSFEEIQNPYSVANATSGIGTIKVLTLKPTSSIDAYNELQKKLDPIEYESRMEIFTEIG